MRLNLPLLIMGKSLIICPRVDWFGRLLYWYRGL